MTEDLSSPTNNHCGQQWTVRKSMEFYWTEASADRDHQGSPCCCVSLCSTGAILKNLLVGPRIEMKLQNREKNENFRMCKTVWTHRATSQLMDSQPDAVTFPEWMLLIIWIYNRNSHVAISSPFWWCESPGDGAEIQGRLLVRSYSLPLPQLSLRLPTKVNLHRTA